MFHPNQEQLVQRGCKLLAILLITIALQGSGLGADKWEVSETKSLNGAVKLRDVTAYPGFTEACFASVVGYEQRGSTLIPALGHLQGDCPATQRPLVFSATHENTENNHHGSANFDPKISSYMGDYDYNVDFGQWLGYQVLQHVNGERGLSLKLDTLNFQKTNVTGWPLQFGHLFVGINDTTVDANLLEDVQVEFDLQITDVAASEDLSVLPYSGFRILVGALLKWDEAPPRTNREHYFEVNLAQSKQFSISYGERELPLCSDAPYDRCFYSTGSFAEGRELSYEALRAPPTNRISRGWTHISIPISTTVRRLGWASRPLDWSTARLAGIYIGLETTGAAAASIQIERYQVYASPKTNPEVH